MSNLTCYDPRARIVFYLLASTAFLITQSAVLLIACAAIGVSIFAWARIPFTQVRAILITVLTFTTFITLTNLVLRTPLEAAQQALRGIAMTGLSLGILLTIVAQDVGVACRQLGLPDKFAFAVELTARFVPTLLRDFRVTIDAQRARGYELEVWGQDVKGYFNAGFRFLPLIIPVVVRAVLDSEDTANAMDMRAFGTGPRTWLRQLRYQKPDIVLMVLGLLLLLATGSMRWLSTLI